MAQELAFGIKAGVAVADITGETDADFEPRAGLTGSMVFGFDFGNGLLFQPELSYITKGAFVDTEATTTIFDENGNIISEVSVPVRARFDLTYLEVPLLLGYRFGRGRMQPRIFAGPTVGYKTSARVHLRPEGLESFTQSSSDDSVQSFDYGAVGGLGVDMDIRGERVTLETRFHLGRANVRDSDPALHNNSLVFLIGIAF